MDTEIDSSIFFISSKLTIQLKETLSFEIMSAKYFALINENLKPQIFELKQFPPSLLFSLMVTSD